MAAALVNSATSASLDSPKHSTSLSQNPPRMLHASTFAAETDHVSMLRTLIATSCLVWFVVVWSVCAIGFIQLYAFRYIFTAPRANNAHADSDTTGGSRSQQYASPSSTKSMYRT